MRNWLGSICLAVLVIVGSFEAPAQLNLPLSRYGIGVTAPNTFASQRGMGFLQSGVSNYQYINQSNPASYTSFYSEVPIPGDTMTIDTTRRYKVFKATAFETGININSFTIRNLSGKTQTSDGSIAYLAMGFPVPKIGGLSVGLMPYSTVSYEVDNNIQGDSAIGIIGNKFTGEGGLFQFYFGGAVQFGSLSVGLNVRHIFGTIERNATIYLQDQPNALSTRNTIKSSVGGMQYELGLQYAINLSENLILRLGATGSPSRAIHARTDSLTSRIFYANGSFATLSTDTLALDYPGKLKLPLSIGGGFVLENPEQWMAGIDFMYKGWSKVGDFQTGGSLNNEWRVSAGFQFVPNSKGSRAISHSKLRLGAYYGQSPLVLDNMAVYDYGMTIGTGLPIIRPKESLFSTLDLALQIGGLGSIDKNGITQSYIQGTIGFNLNDSNWIFKTKFY